jgi:hypothetical protein
MRLEIGGRIDCSDGTNGEARFVAAGQEEPVQIQGAGPTIEEAHDE